MATKCATRMDGMQSAFATNYRMGKARTGMSDMEIAEALGFWTVVPLRSRRNDLSKMSVDELTKLAIILQWTEEEIQEFLAAARK